MIHADRALGNTCMNVKTSAQMQFLQFHNFIAFFNFLLINTRFCLLCKTFKLNLFNVVAEISIKYSIQKFVLWFGLD